VAAPLSPKHAALCADIDIITSNLLDQFARTMCTEISELFAKNNTTIQNATNSLTKQIATLGTRVTQMQQQLLSAAQGPAATAKPAGGPSITSPNPKKERKRKGKGATENKYNVNNLQTNNSTSTHTYADAAKTPTAKPHPPSEHATHATNVEGWENLKKKTQGRKPATSKLILTMYPQAEHKVTCHFPAASPAKATIHAERDYIARQVIADTALHQVNKALVDNQNVTAPPFLCTWVTMCGSIIFTTTNTQNNVIYEDYTTIIADALSYYGKCEKVQIGKRFSQFLLHGVPTHCSLPDMSDSIATNYPQLIQCQTPRWLSPADRYEQKVTSTIVITLSGSTKRLTLNDTTSPSATANANLTTTSNTEEAPSVGTARAMETPPPCANNHPTAPSVRTPTKRKTTHAPSRPAREAPPAPTHQSAAPIATHPTRPATPTAPHASRSDPLTTTRIRWPRPPQETPPWRE